MEGTPTRADSGKDRLKFLTTRNFHALTLQGSGMRCNVRRVRHNHEAFFRTHTPLKSEPQAYKKGTPASPAHALAIRVLPAAAAKGKKKKKTVSINERTRMRPKGTEAVWHNALLGVPCVKSGGMHETWSKRETGGGGEKEGQRKKRQRATSNKTPDGMWWFGEFQDSLVCHICFPYTTKNKRLQQQTPPGGGQIRRSRFPKPLREKSASFFFATRHHRQPQQRSFFSTQRHKQRRETKKKILSTNRSQEARRAESPLVSTRLCCRTRKDRPGNPRSAPSRHEKKKKF